MHAAQDILIPHPSRIEQASQVRSTLLQSSITTLKAHGHYERWHALMEPAHRQTVLEALGPTWVPIEVALAHYRACDELGISMLDLQALGRVTGDRLQGTFLATLSRTARSAGITPWTALPHFDRMWARIIKGGSVQLQRVGPKDMLLDVRHARLTQYEYFRQGYCGLVTAGLILLSARAPQARIVRWSSQDDHMVVRAAWV